MGRKGEFVPRRNNGTKISLAVVCNDMKWLKENVAEIKELVKNTKACVNGHDNRIQQLEDWKVEIDKTEVRDITKFNKKMTIWTIALSIIFFIISLIVNIIIR